MPECSPPTNSSAYGDQPLIDELIDLHMRLAFALQHSAVQQWLELELTMAQFKTLIVVAQRGPIGVNDLAAVLAITQPTASHLVERLSKIDLVERTNDPADRRRSLIQLSPHGIELMATLHRGTQDQLHELLGAMSADNRSALMQGMRAMLVAAESTRPA
ncbi:MAG: winged helix-turn-helix transcriptional regulator [Oscillochloris sp.]|nr:winged helix-turn-helix transcriptional regulator [Oscillochloris sp.]